MYVYLTIYTEHKHALPLITILQRKNADLSILTVGCTIGRPTYKANRAIGVQIRTLDTP